MKKLLLVIAAASLAFVGCEKEEDSNIITEPKEVTIGADLVIKGEGTMKTQSHNYVLTGYTVQLGGALASDNFQDTYTNVDLSTFNITAKVVGDITIEVFHPDFDAQALSTKAYYGTIGAITLPTSYQEFVAVDLDLVQGYTVVTADNGAESLIGQVKINNVPVQLNEYYYTATHDVDVYVTTSRGNLTGTHATDLGHGMKYTVVSVDGNLSLNELPKFDEPGNGDLDPVQNIAGAQIQLVNQTGSEIGWAHLVAVFGPFQSVGDDEIFISNGATVTLSVLAGNGATIDNTAIKLKYNQSTAAGDQVVDITSELTLQPSGDYTGTYVLQ